MMLIRKYIWVLFVIATYSGSFSQTIEKGNSDSKGELYFNYATNSYTSPHEQIENNENRASSNVSTIDVDCNTGFWTINNLGEIQQWNLIDNLVSGGEVILTGGGDGLAYCGASDITSFYSTANPQCIKYYDLETGWENIPTPQRFFNEGGHAEDQYYMKDGNSVLSYYDGNSFTTVDSLLNGSFKVADVAVDREGQAWVFTGATGSTCTSLKVYNSTGLVASYDITFDSNHCYGSFFLNNQLYIAVGNSNGIYPNSIFPVTVGDNTAQLGTAIEFQNNNYYDMANCQDKEPASLSEIHKNNIDKVYLPADGILILPEQIEAATVEVYNTNGQMLLSAKDKNKLNLTALPNGVYLIKIYTDNKIYSKKVLKQ